MIVHARIENNETKARATDRRALRRPFSAAGFDNRISVTTLVLLVGSCLLVGSIIFVSLCVVKPSRGMGECLFARFR